jgi:hypothetical protein
MKKIIAFVLLMCMVVTFVACADKQNTPSETTLPETTAPETTAPEDTAPEITLQEVYDAGKSLAALLGDHESVYVQIVSGGTVMSEQYLNKQYCYSFDDAEYMNLGLDYSDLTTAEGEYVYFDDIYAFLAMITPSGMMDTKERFDTVANNSFISSAMLDDTYVVTEKDGSIIVTCTADMDDITLMDEGIVSCEETYTLDAKTREMTAVKTVYTYADGTIEDGMVTITRDVEGPEGMKPFLAYAQETENVRTVTIVSNPGTENEKTDSIKVPKGLTFGISSDWTIAEAYTLYADAACTQTFDEDWDVNTDLTIYVKWTA